MDNLTSSALGCFALITIINIVVISCQFTRFFFLKRKGREHVNIIDWYFDCEKGRGYYMLYVLMFYGFILFLFIGNYICNSIFK